MIITKTPLRISFFGGGSDYPTYYHQFPGAVLGTTIEYYIHISVKKRTLFFDRPIRVVYSKIEERDCVKEIEHPSVKATLEQLGISEPIEIHVFSDLPAKTGLGSSSAFTVGLIQALYQFQKKAISPLALAEKAIDIEQRIIQENVGSQDQYHAAVGGFKLYTFSKEKIEMIPINVSEEKKQILESSLLLFFTNQMRFASEIAKTQIARMDSNYHYLKKMVEQVFVAKELLESENNSFLEKFGNLLHQGWQMKRELSQEISSSFIDSCYAKALQAGALGGKICGAGGGGMLLIMAYHKDHDRIRKALSDLKEIELKFSNYGSRVLV